MKTDIYRQLGKQLNYMKQDSEDSEKSGKGKIQYYYT